MGMNEFISMWDEADRNCPDPYELLTESEFKDWVFACLNAISRDLPAPPEGER